MTRHPGGASEPLEAFRTRVREWLAGVAAAHSSNGAGQGAAAQSVAVFHDLSADDERSLLEKVQAWQREKFDAGFGALTWPAEFGGAELEDAYAEVFSAEEARLGTWLSHELVSVTLHLVAPTVRLFGTREQQVTLLPGLLRGDLLCCQLFSEPSAGSDLAGLGTRAVRDGDDWVINGQKVWSSGAQYAHWGELIARTDVDAPKHAGLTAFMLPLGTPGVNVRPLRQMSGGTSFCEVFLDDVRVPDALRLGDVGDGWKVALSTLAFERGHSGSANKVGGGWSQLLPLAQALDRTNDPEVRRLLAQVFIAEQLAAVGAQRDRYGPPDAGPRGSLRKLQWVQRLLMASEAAAAVLGARLVADTGEPGTFQWTEHVLGAPGYRIAGGTDEIQRNIIAERLLGMPAEPRLDRGPWREIPR